MKGAADITIAELGVALATLGAEALVVQRRGREWRASIRRADGIGPIGHGPQIADAIMAMLVELATEAASPPVGAFLEILDHELEKIEDLGLDAMKLAAAESAVMRPGGPTLGGEDLIGLSPEKRRQAIQKVVMGEAVDDRDVVDSTNIYRCSVCKGPAHATETDDLERCAKCQRAKLALVPNQEPTP